MSQFTLRGLGALAGVGALVAVGGAAASSDGRDLDQVALEAWLDADVPALGLVVAGGGGEPRIAVAGLRDAAAEASVTEEDAWHWGSITKSMTATLAARLVERGLVAWGDTIGGRLAEVAPEMLEAYRDVTLRHLLSHRGGLQANIPLPRFAEFGQRADDPIEDRARFVRIALSQEPAGPPGETFLYSNNGFVVAGAMLEAATGEPWEVLMRREVFEPLGMVGAGFGAPRGAERHDVLLGHRPVDGVDVAVPDDADNPAALGPAGRAHMPLADMARYLLAHAERRDGFLDAASWEALHTPTFEGPYVMGWIARPDGTLWHNGSNTMWYAEATFDPGRGTVAAAAVNDGDLESVVPKVRALLATLLETD